MRILHLDPDDVDNPLSGGGPRRTLEIYRRLAPRHDITVLTPTFPGSTPEKTRDGIRYVRLGRRIGDHGASHHFTFLASLPRAVRAYDYDLLVEDFMPPASATLTPLFAKRPLIASVQWFYAESWARRYRLPFDLGERYGIRCYRNFVVLTEAMRELIATRHRRARCRVIPNAVDDALFALDATPGDYILYLGNVDFEQKGVDLLLRAYARIPRGERLPLLLAGHGYRWEPVHALIAELGIAGEVSLLGKVDVARRNALLAGCRYVCVPSRRETFGMVILEACASARRVVAFDRWPMSEVAPRGPCALVEAYDVDAYAAAMRELLRAGEGEMRAQGALCRQAARRYDWDTAALAQEAFYESVAAGVPH